MHLVNPEQIPTLLSAILQRSGVSKTQTAQDLGIARSTLNSYLSGDRQIPLSKLGKLLGRLGLNIVIASDSEVDNIKNAKGEPADEALDLAVLEQRLAAVEEVATKSTERLTHVERYAPPEGEPGYDTLEPLTLLGLVEGLVASVEYLKIKRTDHENELARLRKIIALDVPAASEPPETSKP